MQTFFRDARRLPYSAASRLALCDLDIAEPMVLPFALPAGGAAIPEDADEATAKAAVTHPCISPRGVCGDVPLDTPPVATSMTVRRLAASLSAARSRQRPHAATAIWLCRAVLSRGVGGLGHVAPTDQRLPAAFAWPVRRVLTPVARVAQGVARLCATPEGARLAAAFALLSLLLVGLISPIDEQYMLTTLAFCRADFAALYAVLGTSALVVSVRSCRPPLLPAVTIRRRSLCPCPQ